MSKIGIYSDVHISRNSSILPLYNTENDIYTYRLQCCSDSIIEAYKYFKSERVDMVVNCGDTFNSNALTSDEQSTYVNVLKNIYRGYEDEFLPFIDMTLIGNHDKLNDTFNSCSLINLTKSTRLVYDYYYIELEDSDCYFISYCKVDKFNDIVEKMLKEYPKHHKKSILFMHGDINGSKLSGFKVIENRISRQYLTNNFDLIINGHIHCHDVIYNKDNKLVINIGSLMSHSFSDSNKHIGACYIYDTDTEELIRYNLRNKPVFRTYEINSNDDINTLINSINNEKDYKLVIKIICNIDFKEEIKNILDSCEYILKYKFILRYNKQSLNENKSFNVNDTKESIEKEFISFLSQRDDLKSNFDDYTKLLEVK